MPGMLIPFSLEDRGDSNFWNIAETLTVEFRIILPLLPEPITLLELLDANSRCYICEIVLVAGGKDFIVPRPCRRVPLPGVFANPVEAHDAHPLGPFRILGRRHTTFTGSDRLGRVKGEAGDIANRPDHFPRITSREGVGGILDDCQVVVSRNL